MTIQGFVIAVVVLVIGSTGAPAQARYVYVPPIPPLTSPQREADIAALTKWIAHTSGCDDEELKRENVNTLVGIRTLEYYDFNSDGKRHLIVVASSCFTGNAGPDIHSVFSRDGNGGFTEYTLPEVDKEYYEGLTGNHRNYGLSVDLSVEGALLVATWFPVNDGEASPLVIRYKWRTNGFVVDSVFAPYLHTTY